jgi:hypothetical protein
MGYAVKPEDNYRIECYKIISQLGAFKYLKSGVYIISREQLEALKKAGIPYQELIVKPMTSEIREQIKKDKGTEHIFLPIL